jgi:hypothetical protein
MIKKFEDLKKLDSKQIYCLLRNYNLQVGECFLDYNEDYVNKSNLLFYLLGKGLIDSNEANRCINNKMLINADLNELFEEFEIIYNFRLKIIADMSVNFDALLKRLYRSYKEYNLNFEISKDLLEKLIPELKTLY